MSSYRELIPHPALRRVVDRFWISTTNDVPPPRPILPDGCIDVMIDLAHGGHALVVGTMTRASIWSPDGPVRIAAVRFRPGAAPAFLGAAAHELTDRTVPCSEIGARWLARAGERAPTSLAATVASLESLLLERLDSAPAPDPLVEHIVAALFRRKAPSIEALSRATGWSRQHLARRLRFHVGISPKQLARVARLQRAIAALQDDAPGRDGRGLADTALRLGYFDQAHMARDLRALAGVTPGQAREAASSIFPIRSLLADP